MSYVKRLRREGEVGGAEGDLHKGTIASLSTDRFTLRKFVDTCSAAK